MDMVHAREMKRECTGVARNAREDFARDSVAFFPFVFGVKFVCEPYEDIAVFAEGELGGKGFPGGRHLARVCVLFEFGHVHEFYKIGVVFRQLFSVCQAGYELPLYVPKTVSGRIYSTKKKLKNHSPSFSDIIPPSINSLYAS